MNRRIIISCLVLIIAVCFLLSILSISFAGMLLFRSGEAKTIPSTDIPPPIPMASETIILDLTPTSTVVPLGDNPTQVDSRRIGNTSPTPSPTVPIQKNPEPEIEPDILIQMGEIETQVIRDRGLTANNSITRVLLTPEQLRQRMQEMFSEDYSPEDARKDAIVLSAIGLVEPEFELYDFYIDLYSEQVAGFYDQESKEMFVVQGSEFGGTERLTYAHEYVHALQDQHYDIENGLNYNDESCEADSERCAGIQALIEGDASLSELNWFINHATYEDQSDIIEFYTTVEQPVLDNAPPFMQVDLIFPYESGLEFVQYLFDRGGWSAVDQAYLEPPISTEQIIHPERYPHDKPIPVPLPDLGIILGEDWEEIDHGVMGEWYTYLILAHGLDPFVQVDDGDAKKAAEGWGGDAYVAYYHEDDQKVIFLISYIWESPTEAEEFRLTFNEYADTRFGPAIIVNSEVSIWNGTVHYSTFHTSGEKTIWIDAPDKAIADAIREILDIP